MTIPLQKIAATTPLEHKPETTLNTLRNIVRALEGRPPAMLNDSDDAALASHENTHRPSDIHPDQAHLARLPLGIDAVDNVLNGGLLGDGLHEIFPKKAEWDDGLTTAFALAALSRLQASDLGYAISSTTGVRTPRPIVWITQRDTAGATLSPQGLMALGFNPDALFQIEAQSDADALWAYDEILNHPDLGAAVVEVCNLDLAQSHRIQLRAQETQCRGRFRLLMMIRRNKGARQPLVQPTSAATRWRLGPVPPQKIALGTGSDPQNIRVPKPALSVADRLPAARFEARQHSTSHIDDHQSTNRVTSLVPRLMCSPLSRVRWSADLFRQRGGAPADWFLEWSYQHKQFNQLARQESQA